MEKDYRNLFEHRHYGITSWGAVCGGLLTGKYLDGIPEGSRLELAKACPPLSHFFDRYLASDKVEETTKKLRALQEIATANKVSMAALATAWIIAYEDISCALSGFTKLAYVDDNLSALTLVEKWNVDLEKQIEAVLLNAPEQDGDPKTWAPRITRRPH
jgi:aryl-alcohol dehydrogenase-like predicted oxidoreductase